jgi:hypothetical protein
MTESRSAGRERRPTVYVATMETHAYSWAAVGETRDRAIDGVADAMRAHRQQYGTETWHPGYYPGPHNNDGPAEYPDDDAAWLRWLIVDYYSASIVELPMGGGARDGEAISS